MRHAAGIDHRQVHRAAAALVPDRQRRPRPLRHLHLQEELQFIARFVEQVGDAVSRLWQRGALVGKRAGDFVEIQERPDRDAAIDDVFAVIARVVPAAGHVDWIGAARPVGAARIPALEARGHLTRMPGGTRPAIAAGIARLDRDPGALLVEEVECALRQRPVQAGPDREGAAFRSGDGEAVFAGCGKRAKIDDLDAVARGFVRAAGLGAAAGHDLARGIDDAPVERGIAVGRDDRALGTVGQKADLIEMDRRRRRLCRYR